MGRGDSQNRTRGTSMNTSIYEGPPLGASQNQVEEPHFLPPSGRMKRGKNRNKKPRQETPKDVKGSRKQTKPPRQNSDPRKHREYYPLGELSPADLEDIRLLIFTLNSKQPTQLDLSGRRIEEIPFHFSEELIHNVLRVNISHNLLRELPQALHFPNLQELNLSNNFMSSLELNFRFQSLTSLDLSSNKITKFPSPESLECLSALRTLNLFDNLLTGIPTRSFERLSNLEELNLSYNKLSSIPKEISLLGSLRILLLDKNNLRVLPDSITLLNLEDSTFEISGNQLSYPPQEVADRGFSAVKRYIQLLQQEQLSRVPDNLLLASPPLPPPLPIPLNTPIPKKRKSIRINEDLPYDPGLEQPTKSSQYKLIVVGREGAGKTSTIRHLTRNIVMVTGCSHQEEFTEPRYGKLQGVYDSDRYIVRLLPENSDVICRAEHIRLATSVSNPFNFGAVGPPQSTIGIDIDVWKPAITYSLLQTQNIVSASSERFAPPVNLKSYAAALISNTSDSKEQSSKPIAKDTSPWSRTSLPESEGFGVYETSRVGEAYFSGSEAQSSSWKAGSFRNSKKDPSKLTGPEEKPPLDLTLSIWDFAGQDIYHAAHEVFFSPRALYLVVWDMTHHTTKHFNENVQFWIDLIQIRAPGSTIIIVGTKSDLVAPEMIEVIITRLRNHVKNNEEKRKKSIENEIKKAQNPPLLQRLLKQRPNIYQYVAVSCTECLSGFRELTRAVLDLSTPNPRNIHPFQLVNIEIPRYYLEVKEEVESMLRTCSVTNMQQLHENMLDRRKKHTLERCRDLSINDTRDAVTFLSSIGEVVWFGSVHKNSRQRRETKDNMEIVAVEFPDLDDPPPETIDMMTLRNQYSATSVQSDVSFNLDEYYSDNYSSSLRTSEIGDSDTWRDVGGSDSEHFATEKSDTEHFHYRKPTPINISDDLSEIIFLSPHWLLQSMKKILTHQLQDDIDSILNLLDDKALRMYFGGNYHEYIPNGIVRWKFIEEKLLRDIDLPRDDPQLRRVILNALRSLLMKFDIIISLDMSSSANSVDSEMTSDSDYFLIPSLLSNVDMPSIPQYAAPGYVKLERRFNLDKFIPPGLLQRVMARTYFKFGKTRLSVHDPRVLTKNCWKYAFHQGFLQPSCDVIDIWLWLDTDSHQIRLVGFGNIFVAQEIIKRLDKYSQAVSDILASFPGLCNLGETIVCPVCTMHQRSPEHCGSFTSEDISQLKKSLKKMEQQYHRQTVPLGSSPRKVRSSSVDSECSDNVYTDHTEDLLSWRHLKRMCRKHLCGVDSNLLVAIPKALFAEKNFAQHSEFTIEFLMEELVRLSSVPTSVIENCVCKVGHAFSLSSNVLSCLNAIQEYHEKGIASNTPLCLFANITDQASGVYTSLPLAGEQSGYNLKVVLGCEHMIHRDKVANGCSDYFLIGDETHWLYFATLIFKGSDYPPGSRERFQNGEIVARTSSEPLPFSLPCSRSISDPGKVNYHQETDKNIRHPSGSQKLFDQKSWDVAALTILCPIKPHPMNSSNFKFYLCLGDEDQNKCVDESIKVEKKKRKSRCYVDVSCFSPAPEQSLRLLGYQHMLNSLCITWGRVMQPNANGLIMVNLYGDNGTSGGAVVDRDGKLIGLLSKSSTGKQVAYIEPVGPICRVLAIHRYLGHSYHHKQRCSYCSSTS